MTVLKSKILVMYDCDDTLVMWSGFDKDDPELVDVTLPGSYYTNVDGEQSWFGGFTESLKPHKKHIETLKRHKARGDTVVVWSAGGWDWAEAVVKALGLESDVDHIMAKPNAYYDDLECREFMGTRIYYKDDK